ncbi:MAG: hypothetical protein ABSD62_11995 [Candidatus Limnocylindrales bacterium]|jgi:hypothetical protein
MTRYVEASIMTPYAMRGETAWINRILGIWKESAPGLYPDRVDALEPPRGSSELPIDESRFRGSADWYGRRASPGVSFTCQPAVHWHATLTVDVRGAKVEQYLGPASDLIVALGLDMAADYAYVHLADDAAGNGVYGAYCNTLRRGLPPLYWRTYFGAPYVELFGAECLEHADVFRVERVAWGYMLQLTEVPPGPRTWTEYVAARERAADSLGRDAFQTPTKPAERRPKMFDHPQPIAIDGSPFVYRSANDDFEELRAALLSRAKLALEEQGRIEPFAAVITTSYALEPVELQASQGPRRDREIVDELESAIRARVADGSIQASGVVCDEARKSSDPRFTRAVVLSFEHRDGHRGIRVIMPYRRLASGGLEYGTLQWPDIKQRLFQG